MKKTLIVLSFLQLGNISAHGFLFNLTIPIDTSKTKGCNYQKIYYDKAQLKEEGCLVNNVKQGLWLEYTSDGKYIYNVIYDNGVKNGAYKIYYKSGGIRGIGTYKSNTQVDSLTIYAQSGEVIYKCFLKPTGYKTSTITWRKYYDKNAKPDGTFEVKDGKTYMWQLGEMNEVHIQK